MKVIIDNVTPRYLKIGKVNDPKLGKENKKKVRVTRRKKKNDNLWGKLCSSNGDPNPKRSYTRRPKYVVDVKAQKKREKKREFIHRLHDFSRPMPPDSYWPWNEKK